MAIGVLLIYGQALDFGYTNWDDDTYVQRNPDLHALSWSEVLSQASRYVNGNWHPVTMLSYAFDLAMAGKDPRWSHGVNMLLHFANSLLVFLFLSRLLRSDVIAASAALLFAVHPTHVESVAWISARKDLLMFLFGMAMLIAYVKHARHARPWVLASAFFLFLLACASKAMAVSLVPAMLLIDLHLGRSLRKASVWLEKIPFTLVAVAVGLVAIDAQRSMSAIIEAPYSLGPRVVLALANLAIYAGQQLVPAGLSAFHAYPPSGAFPLWWYAAALASVLPLGLIIRSRLWPAWAFGMGFFIVSIALVLQVIPVGEAMRAERYTYLAGAGSALAICAVVHLIAQRIKARPSLVANSIVLGMALAFAVNARERCATWRDSFSLWDDVLLHDPTVVTAYLNRGAAYYTVHNHERAMRDYDKAIALAGIGFSKDPVGVEDSNSVRSGPSLHGLRALRFASALSNRGVIFLQRSEFAAAAASFDRASLFATDASFFTNASYCLIRLGRYRDALDRCDRALALDPGNPTGYGNRSLCRLQLGEAQGALTDARIFKQLAPNDPLSDQVLARAQLATGDRAGACATLSDARVDDPALAAERERLMVLACGPGGQRLVNK